MAVSIARRMFAQGRALALAGALALVSAALLPPVAGASWLTKIAGGAETAGVRAARHAAGALDNAARHIRSLPDRPGSAVVAGEATQEGHWRFVNRAGETFTAGTPDEMKRAASVLFPDAKGEVRLSVYLTEDTVFLRRATLMDLPKGAELYVVAGRESYRILRRGESASERLFAEVRPSVVVEMTERKPFEEAVWQLARPLNRADVRVLALEPGGPARLASSPRIDPASKRAMIDVIDPSSLAAAMGAVRGQTLLITGRVERDLLYVKPSRGPERSLLVGDLFKAAREADVNLVLLQAATTPRQPGGRNWLWQKVEVKGLDEALKHARVADFLNGLAGADRRLAVTATPAEGARTILDVRPAQDLPRGSAPSPIGDVFSTLVSDVTGRVVTMAVQASVRSAERQQELDRRILPGISSSLQIAYLVLVVLGLVGLPVSRAWWSRLWPPEVRTEYAGAAGYRAAQAVRASAFLLVFLPVTSPVAAPLALLRQVYDAVVAPVRWWRWLTGGRRASRGAPDPAERMADAGRARPPGPPPGDWALLDAARRFGNTRPTR